jgi:hypothetical protein
MVKLTELVHGGAIPLGDQAEAFPRADLVVASFREKKESSQRVDTKSLFAAGYRLRVLSLSVYKIFTIGTPMGTGVSTRSARSWSRHDCPKLKYPQRTKFFDSQVRALTYLLRT